MFIKLGYFILHSFSLAFSRINVSKIKYCPNRPIYPAWAANLPRGRGKLAGWSTCFGFDHVLKVLYRIPYACVCRYLTSRSFRKYLVGKNWRVTKNVIHDFKKTGQFTPSSPTCYQFYTSIWNKLRNLKSNLLRPFSNFFVSHFPIYKCMCLYRVFNKYFAL